MAAPLRIVLLVLTCAAWRVADGRLLVGMTLVRDAAVEEALCLDGSLPAYHLHRGFGAGARNWLLQFERRLFDEPMRIRHVFPPFTGCGGGTEAVTVVVVSEAIRHRFVDYGGGWCNDIPSCLDRANSRRGSTTHMSKYEDFNGILSNNASLNPDFYNWNRVKLRYCDGASFAGDSKFDNGTILLYFRGQRIWRAIILDLLPKGLGQADKALLSGCSAGGLSTFLHCDNFTSLLPDTTSVKCLSDAGLFLDERDISMNHTIRSFFYNLMFLQGVKPNLHSDCTGSIPYPHLCFFPQYALKYITTPFFILNSAYDVYQFHHILVPPSADPRGHWNRCKLDPAACNANQIQALQGFRRDMLSAVSAFFKYSKRGGMYINSCFAHCQSELQDTWLADDSPRIHDKTIAGAVGDWYFGRRVSKLVDCAYPCDSTCHNIIP